MNLGEKIKKLRLDNGLKQKDLSEILGISISNISKYESNDVAPSLETIKTLSKIFGVSVEYLIGSNQDALSKYFNILIYDKYAYILGSKSAEDIIEIIDNSLYMYFTSEDLAEIYNNINHLSERSKKDLLNYIELLQLRDLKKDSY